MADHACISVRALVARGRLEQWLNDSQYATRMPTRKFGDSVSGCGTCAAQSQRLGQRVFSSKLFGNPKPRKRDLIRSQMFRDRANQTCEPSEYSTVLSVELPARPVRAIRWARCCSGEPKYAPCGGYYCCGASQPTSELHPSGSRRSASGDDRHARTYSRRAGRRIGAERQWSAADGIKSGGWPRGLRLFFQALGPAHPRLTVKAGSNGSCARLILL